MSITTGPSAPATDVPSNLLAYAAHSARMAGLGDVVDTAIMDRENLDVNAGTYGGVISRVGLKSSRSSRKRTASPEPCEVLVAGAVNPS